MNSVFAVNKSHSAQNTTALTTTTPPQCTDREILDYLTMALEHGIKKIYSISSSYQNKHIFFNLSDCLLRKLAERGADTSIEVSTPELTVKLQEVDDFILITINKVSSALFDNSFRNLLQNFIIDILSNSALYPNTCLHYALDYVLIDEQDSDLNVIECALRYVIQHPDYQTSTAVKFAAAKCIFHADADFSEYAVKRIAEMVVYSSENCKGVSVIQGAGQILMNKKAYSHESIRAASIIVVMNAHRCSCEILKLAGSDIVENPSDYPQGFSAQAASEFIKKNLSFFSAHQNQYELLAFFNKFDQVNNLQNYSDQLGEILCSKGYDLIIYVMKPNTNLVEKRLSILGAWSLCEFDRVLREDRDGEGDIAEFILKNMDHPAIALWNSPTEINLSAKIMLGNDTLATLCECMKKNCPRLKNPPPIFLIENILRQLMDIGNLTEFEAHATGLRFCQTNDGSVNVAPIGTESPGITLANTSFKQIQKNLINNFIFTVKNGALGSDTVNFALTNIMGYLDRDAEEFVQSATFYKDAVIYIIGTPANLIDNELIVTAAKHIFKYMEHYASRYALAAAQAVIRLSENCRGKYITDAAHYLVQPHLVEPRLESILSAALYIALNAYRFSPNVFSLAAHHIANNTDAYSNQFISEAALNFTKQRADFFKCAINDQPKFVEFYEQNNGLDLLEDYSKNLKEALDSDQRQIPVFIKRGPIECTLLIHDEQESTPAMFTIPRPNQSIMPNGKTLMTVYELWSFGYFKSALKNRAICIFVLEQTAHGAIVLRNNHDKLHVQKLDSQEK